MTKKLSCSISALKNKAVFEWKVIKVRVILLALDLQLRGKYFLSAKKQTLK
jgi:hypothetical protein